MSPPKLQQRIPSLRRFKDVTTEAKTNVVAEGKMLRCVPIPAIAPCVDRLPPDATGCHWVAGATFALDVGYLTSGNNKTRNGNTMQAPITIGPMTITRAYGRDARRKEIGNAFTIPSDSMKQFPRA